MYNLKARLIEIRTQWIQRIVCLLPKLFSVNLLSVLLYQEQGLRNIYCGIIRVPLINFQFCSTKNMAFGDIISFPEIFFQFSSTKNKAYSGVIRFTVNLLSGLHNKAYGIR